ncbi:hypothetical protein PTKIN_Ptkin08bG0121900 [Pterospermum kingtungense]
MGESTMPAKRLEAFYNLLDDISDDEMGNEDENDDECPIIKVSLWEKRRLRTQWMNARIINLIGHSVGYNFLVRRLRSLWKISSAMDVIDVGQDVFLVRFVDKNEYDRALYNGSLVVADHYLSEDWETSHGGYYDLICRERAIYEDVHLRYGHRKEDCKNGLEQTVAMEDLIREQVVQPKDATLETDETYGKWMLVTKNPHKNGKHNGKKQIFVHDQGMTTGSRFNILDSLEENQQVNDSVTDREEISK